MFPLESHLYFCCPALTNHRNTSSAAAIWGVANPPQIRAAEAHYFLPIHIMSDSTTTPDEGMPPSDTTDQPSEEATDTVESLKEKLAAEEKKRLEAEQKAAEWKNRVKEENPPKKRERGDSSEEYSDWRIDNRSRIALVKEEYEKELEELQSNGAKLSITLRDKALKLAEATVGVKTKATDPLPSGMVDRGGEREPKMTDHDVLFKVNPEIKKKYPVTW